MVGCSFVVCLCVMWGWWGWLWFLLVFCGLLVVGGRVGGLGLVVLYEFLNIVLEGSYEKS